MTWRNVCLALPWRLEGVGHHRIVVGLPTPRHDKVREPPRVPHALTGGPVRTSTRTEMGRARVTYLQGECAYRGAEEEEEEEGEGEEEEEEEEEDGGGGGGGSGGGGGRGGGVGCGGGRG